MDETKKMLQTIINGQSAMKSELLGVIQKVDKKVDALDKKMGQVENRLTERIDKIGLQVARLEDDAPTIGNFDKLEKRVTKLENQIKN